MDKKNKPQKSTSSRNISIAAGAWLLMVIVLLGFFLVNRKTIVTNWTTFSRRVFSPKGAQSDVLTEEEVKEITRQEAVSPVTISMESAGSQSPAAAALELAATSDRAGNRAETEETESAGDGLLPTGEMAAGWEGLASAKALEQQEAAAPQMDVELCFMTIDAEGNMSRRVITRKVPKSPAPLTSALRALLEGPTYKERTGENCVSLIPENTMLLGASIKNGVAYLNFSEEFEINTYGGEGYTAQLMQVVYTATSFPTVSSVQFLVGGEKRDYLGSDFPIGSAFSRASFR